MTQPDLTRRSFLHAGSAGAIALLQQCLFPSLTLGELSSAEEGARKLLGSAHKQSPIGTSNVPVDIESLFLGSKAENAGLLEELIAMILRDHIQWRRNFHPEDEPVVSRSGVMDRARDGFIDSFRRELSTLLERLRSSVPFYSPRYMGHMTSDVALPALIGFFAAMLQNQNNVSWKGSPVTTLLEIEVGRQFAKMLGFGSTPEELARTWGHLTSGGTVANLESLWVAKSLKFLPVSIRHAASELGITGLKSGPEGRELEKMSALELVGLSPSESLRLRDEFLQRSSSLWRDLTPEEAVNRANTVLKKYDILSMGDHAFFCRLLGGSGLEPAVVLAPETMHYSWQKGLGALGIGSAQVVPVAVDSDYRMRPDQVRKELERALSERRPVISLVCVAGTTEEGAIDPVHEMVAIRDAFSVKGFSFFVHCDAAYGGYLSACFRAADGSLRSAAAMRSEYSGWPSDTVHRSYAALKDVDSITIDPHKLGYVPYPAGAIVFRDARVKELIAQEAAYALGGRADQNPGEIFIGKYILEGSKPGAAAASVYLSNRVVPLNETGYGLLLGQTIRAAREFHDRIMEFGSRIEKEFTLQPLTDPDTNVLVYVVNAANNRRLDLMNRLNMIVYRDLSVSTGTPVQNLPFIVSHAELAYETYNVSVLRNFLETRMGIPGELLVSGEELAKKHAAGITGYDSQVTVLRTVIMNPFVLERAGRDGNYIGLFLDTMIELARKGLAGLRK
ncbi:MAG: pyridoxal-dependent decarboxylase [Syntrophobacteraceae bacterium]